MRIGPKLEEHMDWNDKQQWNDCGSEYDFIHIEDGVFAPIYDVIAEDVIRETGSRSGMLLDIGCGGGHLGRAVMRRTAHRGCFLDINKTAVALAKERARWDGLEGRSSFVCADVERMELPDGFADLIISRGSCQFWGDLERAFAQIVRVLAPGGKTYIGGGCGSAELLESIRVQMRAIEPDWEQTVRRRSEGLTTERLRGLLDGFHYPYRIFEEDGKGRWVIISKDR